jgi:preprotein translocase subunit SecD
LSRALLFPALALALLFALACGGGDEPTASLTLTADVSQLPAGIEPDEALSDAAGILRQRADRYGITEPQITVGGEIISVSLKGIAQADAADLMTRRGVIEFKREQVTVDGLVVCKTLEGEEFGVRPQAVNPDPASRSLARCISLDKLGDPIWIDVEADDGTGAGTVLTTDHVEAGSWESRNEDTALAFRFTPEGSALVRLVTDTLTGYHLGIFVDGQLIAAPRIQRAITDGTALISGFAAGQARILAAVLNTPPLQIPSRSRLDAPCANLTQEGSPHEMPS